MSITTLSSRQFNQDASKAKKAAMTGPVVITDRGRPAHVLLSFEAYKKLTGDQSKIADLLSMDGIDAIELAIPQWPETPRAAEFD